MNILFSNSGLWLKYIRFHYTFSHGGLWLKSIADFTIPVNRSCEIKLIIVIIIIIIFNHSGLWLKSISDFTILFATAVCG